MVLLKKEERARRKELYSKLYELVKEFGAWSVNCNQLAEDWRIPHRTVLNWKDKASKEIGEIDITSVGRDVRNQMEANLRLAHRAVRHAAKQVDKPSPGRDNLRAFAAVLKAYNDTVSKHTEFAERWGYKAIQTRKLEISQESEQERLARIVREMDESKSDSGDLEEEDGEDFTDAEDGAPLVPLEESSLDVSAEVVENE